MEIGKRYKVTLRAKNDSPEQIVIFIPRQIRSYPSDTFYIGDGHFENHSSVKFIDATDIIATEEV